MCVYRWVFHEISADKTYFRRTHNLPWFNFIADFWSPLSPPTNSTIVDGSKHQTKHYKKNIENWTVKLLDVVLSCFIMFHHADIPRQSSGDVSKKTQLGSRVPDLQIGFSRRISKAFLWDTSGVELGAPGGTWAPGGTFRCVEMVYF